ncbi:Hsp33 family molecular chaperone HslO, partial [Bacillus sp. JCM 19041]|uniref:Hsp33 family molecular chaperone HslO n=1 Tax=Bacillus sp. JCM 19041 TaxID=1460637 RepID=UPI0006CFACC3
MKKLAVLTGMVSLLTLSACGSTDNNADASATDNEELIELQEANEELTTTIEELETENENLQAEISELESNVSELETTLAEREEELAAATVDEEDEEENEDQEEVEAEASASTGDFENVIANLDEAEVTSIIKADAEADWEDDYSMQEYVIKETNKCV